MDAFTRRVHRLWKFPTIASLFKCLLTRTNQTRGEGYAKKRAPTKGAFIGGCVCSFGSWCHIHLPFWLRPHLGNHGWHDPMAPRPWAATSRCTNISSNLTERGRLILHYLIDDFFFAALDDSLSLASCVPKAANVKTISCSGLLLASFYVIVLKLFAMPWIHLPSFFLLKYQTELHLSKIMFSTFVFECQVKNWHGGRKLHWWSRRRKISMPK